MNIQVTPFRLTPNFTQHSQNNNSFNYNKFLEFSTTAKKTPPALKKPEV